MAASGRFLSRLVFRSFCIRQATVLSRQFPLLVTREPNVFHKKVQPVRALATLPKVMDDNVYHSLADHTIDTLMELFDELGDQIDLQGYDAMFSNGVITLRLGNLGTYVINKQPPNKQIWLSSPISGPKRYDYNPIQRQWIYAHDGESLEQLLTRELSHLLRRPISVNLKHH